MGAQVRPAKTQALHLPLPDPQAPRADQGTPAGGVGADMCGQVQLTYGTATHCPQGNDLHLRPTERGWTVLGLSSGAVPSGCAGWPLPARGPRSAPGSMARPPHPCFSACAPPPSWPPRSHGRGLGRFCSATEPRKGKGLAGGGCPSPSPLRLVGLREEPSQQRAPGPPCPLQWGQASRPRS